MVDRRSVGESIVDGGDLNAELLRRWLELCQRLSLRGDAAAEGHALIARYCESGLAYHNLAHVSDCLELLGGVAHLSEASGLVELAIWFHDAVYVPGAADNEAASAKLARDVLGRLGLSEARLGRVRGLIQATSHRDPPQSGDGKLLCDIDLSILAAPGGRYEEYAGAIRVEAGLSEDEFRGRRIEFLQGMLARPHIFHTDHFREQMEAAARENMQRELGDLSRQAERDQGE